MLSVLVLVMLVVAGCGSGGLERSERRILLGPECRLMISHVSSLVDLAGWDVSKRVEWITVLRFSCPGLTSDQRACVHSAGTVTEVVQCDGVPRF